MSSNEYRPPHYPTYHEMNARPGMQMYMRPPSEYYSFPQQRKPSLLGHPDMKTRNEQQEKGPTDETEGTARRPTSSPRIQTVAPHMPNADPRFYMNQYHESMAKQQPFPIRPSEPFAPTRSSDFMRQVLNDPQEAPKSATLDNKNPVPHHNYAPYPYPMDPYAYSYYPPPVHYPGVPMNPHHANPHPAANNFPYYPVSQPSPVIENQAARQKPTAVNTQPPSADEVSLLLKLSSATTHAPNSASTEAPKEDDNFSDEVSE